MSEWGECGKAVVCQNAGKKCDSCTRSWNFEKPQDFFESIVPDLSVQKDGGKTE